LYAAELTGANPVRLSPPGLYAAANGAAFSPDGQTIAFSSFVPCGWRCTRSTLHVVGRDGTGLRRVAEDASSPSWASDSGRFAYQGPDGIYVYDLESERSKLVAYGRAIKPVWAPRGDRIAYSGLRGRARACFVNANGSRPRCTSGRQELTSLVWSRDGKRVAFRAATQRLGFVDSDAKRIRYLAGEHGQHARPAAWSPDGKRLAYWFGSYGSYDGLVRVLRLAAPARSRRIVQEEGNLADLRWRGRKISYVVMTREGP
jgi:Tol biopolymer transport system component